MRRVPALEPGRERAEEHGQHGIDRAGQIRDGRLQQIPRPDRREQIQNRPAGRQNAVRVHEQRILRRRFAARAVYLSLIHM